MSAVIRKVNRNERQPGQKRYAAMDPAHKQTNQKEAT